ncbi:hypothetical protein OG474_24510 [Kribbella sp. NBC_01505]|uniref:hypothetical protein n=1 Tax=Kribbella sp. NBC_01505 TaxID=2903580 RepID=UPI003867B7D6
MTGYLMRTCRVAMAAALFAVGLTSSASASPAPGELGSAANQPQPGYVRVEITDAASRPPAMKVMGECTAPGLCGVIYNPNYDGIPFGIIHSWGEEYSAILQKGQRSKIYWADTDGFYVGAGACGRWGVWTPTETGGYWRDYFYNGPQKVKVFDYIYDHHVTAWNRPC